MKLLSFSLALLFTSALFLGAAQAQDEGSTYEGQIHGRVATLGEIKGPTNANVGGLLIVKIADSGSRPPRQMTVDFQGSAFKRLGKVRGINVKDGRALMGGGYTWFLLTPREKGTHEIKLSYVDANNKTVKQSYQVEVTEEND